MLQVLFFFLFFLLLFSFLLFLFVSFSLCFIQDGVFLFWEHIYAAGKFPLSMFQWIITKCFWFVPCGCNLTLETWKVIEEAEFSKHEYVKCRIAVMPLVSPTLFGHAIK